jgi:hypothetical protein
VRTRVAACAVLLAACAPVVVSPEQSVPFASVARGAASSTDAATTVVIRTAEDWRKFWPTHGTPPAPAVDFSRFAVAGVFLGTRPTAGFSVEITAARRAGEGLVVEWIERKPEPGQMVAQVLTSPFHLVTIPADSKTIEFKERSRPP